MSNFTPGASPNVDRYSAAKRTKKAFREAAQAGSLKQHARACALCGSPAARQWLRNKGLWT